MAERGATAVAYSSLVEFEAFRRSLYMGLSWRGLESDFQRARQVTLNTITDNIVAETITDSEALETAPSFTTADMSLTTYSRALVRATSQYNILQAMEGPGPARLDSTLSMRLAEEVSLKMDEQALTALTGATFGTSAGNGFVVETVGTSFSSSPASGLDRNTGRFKTKGTNPPLTQEKLLDDLIESFADAEVTYRNKNIMGGTLIGDGQPTGYAFVCHPIVARALISWAKVKGELDLSASAAYTAARGSGILSMMAYEGRVHNFDIISNTGITHANNAATVSGYFVPLNSALVGGVRPMLWDFARYGQGNTGGAAVSRSTVICPYFSGRARQQDLGRVQINVG